MQIIAGVISGKADPSKKEIYWDEFAENDQFLQDAQIICMDHGCTIVWVGSLAKCVRGKIGRGQQRKWV